MTTWFEHYDDAKTAVRDENVYLVYRDLGMVTLHDIPTPGAVPVPRKVFFRQTWRHYEECVLCVPNRY